MTDRTDEMLAEIYHAIENLSARIKDVTEESASTYVIKLNNGDRFTQESRESGMANLYNTSQDDMPAKLIRETEIAEVKNCGC